MFRVLTTLSFLISFLKVSFALSDEHGPVLDTQSLIDKWWVIVLIIPVTLVLKRMFDKMDENK